MRSRLAIAGIEADIAPIDILVNNAAIQIRASLDVMTIDDWRTLIDHDLTSVFVVGRAVGVRMAARGRGKIINICSMQSELGRPTIGPYAAAKGGVKMLTRAMCAEWAPRGIQVNGLGPGYFATEMTAALRADPGVRRVAPQAHAGRPLGRPGGAGRGGRVPGVGRVGLRQRPHPVRGRRDAGGRLTRVGPSAARRRRRPASAAAGPRGGPPRCRWPGRSSAPGRRAWPSRCAA